MVGIGIKKLREKNNLTQTDLAQRLGVSRQAISMWEADKRELKASMVKKIAQVFRVSVDEILKKHAFLRKEKEMPKKIINKRIKIKARKTQFQLKAPEASNVVLTGDFNSWDQQGLTMKKTKDGVWKVGMILEPGKYEYRFIVDGQWWTDPGNGNITSNSFGSLNSVKEVLA